MAGPKNNDKDAVDRVKKLGYRVRKPGRYVKTSFLVHQATLGTFREMAQAMDFQIQEALTEALEMWCEKYAEEYDKAKGEDR